MRTTQLSRIKETFLLAMDRGPEEREAFVRAECDDDPVVRTEVLRLLRIRQRVTGTMRPLRAAFASAAGGDGTGSPAVGTADEAPAAETARRAGTQPQSGDLILGRYELRDAIGAGAFGTVYRAFDRITREMVAVKTAALTSRRARDWHLREVATLRRARVPGVVELLATGQTDEWAIVVMSLVDGTPFPGADLATGDAEAILPRAVALLEAVGRLHAAGVYHRDLKPANVLVSAGGLVTLVDFGIAQDETDATRWGGDDTLAGTLPYLAPERLRGARATGSSELYAVGVIVIEALTGETPDAARRHLAAADALARYSDVARGMLEGRVPAAVSRLLSSLVAEDPRDRPVDAWAAIDALRESLGPSHAIELPRLGDDAAVRAVVEAAGAGRALDVAGPRGSGRTRVLQDAERQLRDAGFLVQWVRPARTRTFGAGALDRGIAAPGPSPDALDREHRASLRQRVADGLVVLVDDFDDLEPPVRDLVSSLRPAGAVVRVVGEPEGDCVRIDPLRPAELEPLVRGPERLFHIPSEVARLLWQRTRGRPREVTREVRSWCVTGLAAWEDGLRVGPRDLDRLRAAGGLPASASELSARLPPGVQEVWDALSLVGEPVSVAALADVLQRPTLAVGSELGALARQGLVEVESSGARVDLVHASPSLAEVPVERRREWSERVAAHLGPRSAARFRHLVAAEQYERACRTAIDVAVAAIEAGDVAAAVATLDPALSIARRHAPANADLYADLLGTMVRAALNRADRNAVGLALYHANLAPDRGERIVAWAAILESAESCLAADAGRALAQIDAIPGLPTEAHRLMAHVVANFAARTTRSLEVQRARVAAAAAWVRRGGGREARAKLSGWTGWLRHEEGRYGAARRLHERAARLARGGRSRRTSNCNAAMAALEAGELQAARVLADETLRTAQRGGDPVNEARAELVLRQCLFRRRVAASVDEELLAAAERLDRGPVRGMIRLTEAAVALRVRRIRRAGELGALASDDLRTGGERTAGLLADALALACGNRSDPDLLAVLEADGATLEPIGIAAQAAALAAAAVGPAGVPQGLAHRAALWAENAPRPDMPREVLSPDETGRRLGSGARAAPDPGREEGR